MRRRLLKEDIEFEILGLKDKVTYTNLPPVAPPQDPAERKRLQTLEPQFRSSWRGIAQTSNPTFPSRSTWAKTNR